MSRRIVITGGGSGIGKMIAQSFKALGDKIAVCDNSESHIKNLKQEIPDCLAVTADVTNTCQMKDFCSEVMNQYGGVDVLISNAGTSGPASQIENLSLSEWQSCLNVNLNGAFLICRWGAKIMKAQGSGVIILISSTSGLFGVPNRSPYVTAKWGLIGLTKTLAMELGPSGIRVNAICPGTVEGNRIEKVIEMESRVTGKDQSEISRVYQDGVSLRRFTKAKDVANMAVFLASNTAGQITGQALAVDGNTERMV